MKQKDIIAIIAVAVVLGGLYLFSDMPSVDTSNPSAIEESQLPPTPAEISVGTYKLALYGGANDTSPQNVAEKGYTLSYEDGQVRGKICNTFSGGVTVADNKVTAPSLVSTKMACEPQVMSIETALFAALAAGAEFRSAPEGLVLFGDGTLFVFEKVQ